MIRLNYFLCFSKGNERVVLFLLVFRHINLETLWYREIFFRDTTSGAF